MLDVTAKYQITICVMAMKTRTYLMVFLAPPPGSCCAAPFTVLLALPWIVLEAPWTVFWAPLMVFWACLPVDLMTTLEPFCKQGGMKFFRSRIPRCIHRKTVSLIVGLKVAVMNLSLGLELRRAADTRQRTRTVFTHERPKLL